MSTLSGGCQCGNIRFRAGSLIDNAHVCHCRMCQKATGNLFAALVGVPEEDLEWTRGAPAVWESSGAALRGFCPDCGTPLFYRGRGSAHVSLSIGAFDDPGAIPLAWEGGVESRLPQIAQLGHLPAHATPADLAARTAADNRQHPDSDTWDDPEDFPV